MSERYFSVTEANDLVPVLGDLFRRMLQLRGELRRAYHALEQLGHEPNWDALQSPADVPEHVRPVHGRFLALAMALSQEFETLINTGVQVKDPETGRCDFPCLVDGRVVLLCWKLGEPKVDFWHETGDGFAGRQPMAVLAAADPAVRRAHGSSHGQA